MNDMAAPQLVIFDCDGVVVDSEIISARVLIALLAELGVQTDPTFVFNHCLGRSFPTVAKHLAGAFDLTLPEGFEADYRTRLLQVFETELRPMPGLRPVLSGLNVPFCIASSSSPERVQRSLTLTGLYPYFTDRIFTASQVSRGKPAPDLFLLAAETLGIKPQNALVIEDSIVGVEAGLAAGMRVLRFTGGGHMRAVDPGARLEQFVPPNDARFAEFEGFDRFFDLLPGLRS